MVLSFLTPRGVAIETVTAEIAESQNKLLLDKAMHICGKLSNVAKTTHSTERVAAKQEAIEMR
jgi:hypothetical protein